MFLKAASTKGISTARARTSETMLSRWKQRMATLAKTRTALIYQQQNNKYEGDWNHGLKQGFGVFIWADGSRYEGDFKEDLFHGEGEYTRSDGKHYKGKLHG